eukprot:TRINITY_DN64352_c0_g1_i1.p1 TRINITY_DN64352_c0_g1~~TRINITY_DN64352_c0_g1_i1.p1  ORF type:complete len:928 (+),score=60.54 TRINITY_DN64352_c0_g1_i1:39-2822(+)
MLTWRFLALVAVEVAAISDAPYGLLVDLKPPPHLGVDRPRPRISWIVPHLSDCNATSGQYQSRYQVQLSNSTEFGEDLLELGHISSQDSLSVLWPGPELKPARTYWWRVRTWTSEGCQSGWSEPAKIVTGNFGRKFEAAKPVWLDGANFAFFRKDIELVPDRQVVSAYAYAVAVPVGYNMEKFLGAYRLYVDGIVVGTGPGRGSHSYSQPGEPDYDTLDVTHVLCGKRQVTLALQGFSDKNDMSAKVLLEVHIQYDDGSEQVSGTDSTWFAFNANALFGGIAPHISPSVQGPPENIDARLSPSGNNCMTCWRLSDFKPCSPAWSAASERAYFPSNLSTKITQPISVRTGVKPARVVEVGHAHWLFDFGTEIMAGVELQWYGGEAVLELIAGEELTSNSSVLFPMRTGNRYQMNWTAGPGNSSFEQHEYWEFRYGELKVVSPNSFEHKGGRLPFNLTAWVVRYPWSDSDSSFNSSDTMLNDVWELCRNTLKVTSLDTTTDSNTRERLPYEADGYITGASRYVLQREFAWQRHSTQHNLLNPTWPTEWRQTIPLLIHADYMTTGDAALANAYWDLISTSSLVTSSSSSHHGCIDVESGLLDFCRCSRHRPEGVRDIVDWPQVYRDGYRMTDVNTVINSYAFGGLQALAKLANATGRPTEAANFQKLATTLGKAMANNLFNASTGLFVDGLGGDASTHSAWHAQVFPLFFGAVGAERSASMMAFLKSRRMVGSVYAAFAFLLGLYRFDDDHGAFALEMMTTCDENSWCNMLRQGATAVMEAWTRQGKPNLSWSHPWASAPVTAIAQGLMGIKALAPGHKQFEVRPKPGKLHWAEIRLPTHAGFIYVRIEQNIAEFRVSIVVPGNTNARVCLPRRDEVTSSIIVDGESTMGYLSGDFVCINGVGSGEHELIRKANVRMSKPSSFPQFSLYV